MSQTKRVSGAYTIAATGGTTVDSALTVTGNLTVTGTTTTLETTNAEITDRQIVLNKGESGAGVTGVYSGIEVERGSVDNAWLKSERFLSGPVFPDLLREIHQF